MNNKQLQKRSDNALKEKGQYFIAFGVIAVMLVVAGFPTFVTLFFGVFAYFLWRIFASPSRGETRDIFEFYLAANDILRDDERRWFGFEIRKVIDRGEKILKSMSSAPPLVYFTLGALYQKAGDHQSAVQHLSYIIENETAGELNYAYPSRELENYVKVLRNIEREPHEAPLTAAAIRALERARHTRGKALLENSRALILEHKEKKQLNKQEKRKLQNEQAEKNGDTVFMQSVMTEFVDLPHENAPENEPVSRFLEPEPTSDKRKRTKKDEKPPFADRKPISELLHDIYDKNN